MQLRITPEIFEKFPDVVVGVVFMHGINNRGEHLEVLEKLREACDTLSERFGAGDIATHPSISCWREAYRSFGAKPSRYPSSIENLVRRVLKGESVRHISTLVDLYNVISLRYLLPVGGEDLSKVKGDILLTLATGTEPPVVLLGEPEARPPHPGEVIYRDDAGVLCRRWNWKEAERTKLEETTTDAILVLEGLPPIAREVVERATKDLLQHILEYCGGEGSFILLGRTHPEWEA